MQADPCLPRSGRREAAANNQRNDGSLDPLTSLPMGLSSAKPLTMSPWSVALRHFRPRPVSFRVRCAGRIEGS